MTSGRGRGSYYSFTLVPRPEATDHLYIARSGDSCRNVRLIWDWVLLSVSESPTLSRSLDYVICPNISGRSPPTPQNMSDTFKQRLKSGEEVLMLITSFDMGRSELEDSLALGSYDAIFIDGQHSTFSEDQITKFCAVTEELGVPTQMRIPHTRFTYMVGRYCDFGLSSVMVPEVMEETSVDEAIECFYYGTLGRRSWGGGARAGLQLFDSPVDRPQYAEWWNNFGVLCLQLESVEGVTRSRKFARREGVDYLAFGPNDLLFSLERHPGYSLGTVEDCVRNVADQVKDLGVPLCWAIPTTEEGRDKYRELGISVFWEGSRLNE